MATIFVDDCFVTRTGMGIEQRFYAAVSIQRMGKKYDLK
jgi:hypothetical protein